MKAWFCGNSVECSRGESIREMEHSCQGKLDAPAIQTLYCFSRRLAPLPAYCGGVFAGRALRCWVETEGFSCFYQNLQGLLVNP